MSGVRRFLSVRDKSPRPKDSKHGGHHHSVLGRHHEREGDGVGSVSFSLLLLLAAFLSHVTWMMVLRWLLCPSCVPLWDEWSDDLLHHARGVHGALLA